MGRVVHCTHKSILRIPHPKEILWYMLTKVEYMLTKFHIH
jgi:hypothetical protein